jgi:hypothetical protein
MKRKLGFFFGFAVLLVAAIFTEAGCNNGGGGGGGNTDPKSITITGLGGKDGFIEITIMSEWFERRAVALGSGTLSTGSVTIDLKNNEGHDWTASGSYFIMLDIDTRDFF